MSKFTLNEADQREREHRVAEYLKKEHLLDVRDFRCRHLNDCKSSCAQDIDFTEGQLHHIGAHYSLLRDDQPFRVVVMGQQYSGGEEPTGLDERRDAVRNCHHFKPKSAIRQKDDENNPHMTGTLLALRLLFEKPLPVPPIPFVEDDSNMEVGGQVVSIFDCFALTNYLLCSATPEVGSGTKATPTMWKNCREHIGAVLHILQPTHLVLQGVASYIDAVTGHIEKDKCTTINTFGVETHVFSFNHPSARSMTIGWGVVTEKSAAEDSYLSRVVEPVIKGAIK